MKDCLNQFAYSGYSGSVKNGHLFYRCRCGCSREKTLPMTRADEKVLRISQPDVHRVWHEFCRKFGANIGWKSRGAELQDAVEEWAEKYPEDVQIVGCDDNHFMSSILVLIEHQAKDRYMGTSVIFIPQNEDDPSDFFLYPGHRGALEKALATIWRKSQKTMNRQNKVDRSRFRYFAKRAKDLK